VEAGTNTVRSNPRKGASGGREKVSKKRTQAAARIMRGRDGTSRNTGHGPEAGKTRSSGGTTGTSVPGRKDWGMGEGGAEGHASSESLEKSNKTFLGGAGRRPG